MRSRVDDHDAIGAAHLINPEKLLRSYRFAEPVLVMRPTMPDRQKYHEKIERIWDSRWLANDGELHGELVAALSRYLGVSEISLCCNGTVALLIALQSCRINGGEVITTPFTFPATAHALYWNRVQPVFCDIDEKTFNLDPDRIEEFQPDSASTCRAHVRNQHDRFDDTLTRGRHCLRLLNRVIESALPERQSTAQRWIAYRVEPS